MNSMDPGFQDVISSSQEEGLPTGEPPPPPEPSTTTTLTTPANDDPDVTPSPGKPKHIAGRGSIIGMAWNREETVTPPKDDKEEQEQRRLEAQLLGEPENIQVLVRVRPRLDNEIERGLPVVVDCVRDGNNKNYVTIQAGARRAIRCKYDCVFDPESKQDEVYKCVEDCAKRVLEGYNSTILAYGQTGSGKTYTMFGPQGCNISPSYPSRPSRHHTVPEVAGVIPRAIADIFNALRKRSLEQQQGKAPPQQISVYCSFVQIYNEQLFDMLRDANRYNPLLIHEDNNHEIYVQGLSEFLVNTVDECLALLKVGEENRAIRETHMNQSSSRSHSIFQLVIEQKQPGVDGSGSDRLLRSKLNLVDLAGSEKWDLRQDLCANHTQELTNINFSLFTLGRCIGALTTKTGGHVPYRDSKLTRLIQDSLGGNTRTRIIATLSPISECTDETISTLKFADRAKQVLVYVRRSEKPVIDHHLIDRLQREISQLRGLIVKLKETSGGSVLNPINSDQIPKRFQGMNLIEVVEKFESLEEESRRDKAEVHRLRVENSELRRAFDTMRPRSGTMSAGSDHEVHSGGTRTPMSSTNSPSKKTLVATQGQNKADGVDGNGSERQPPPQPHLAQQLRQLERDYSLVVSMLQRFFAFEVEEAELRRALAPIVPNVDEFIPPTPPRSTLPRIQSHSNHSTPQPHIPCPQPRPQEPLSVPPPPAAAHSSFSTPSRSDNDTTVLEQLVLPKLHAEGLSSVQYRIRGGPTNQVQAFQNVAHIKTDEEQQLIRNLQEARKRMRKHLQLQEWLLKKEKKELDALQREEDDRRAMQTAKKEKDLKFRERAARQKKKLQAYYASLRQQAQQDADGATPTTGGFDSFSPSPPVPITLTKRPSGVEAAKHAAAAYEAYLATNSEGGEGPAASSPLSPGSEGGDADMSLPTLQTPPLRERSSTSAPTSVT